MRATQKPVGNIVRPKNVLLCRPPSRAFGLCSWTHSSRCGLNHAAGYAGWTPASRTPDGNVETPGKAAPFRKLPILHDRAAPLSARRAGERVWPRVERFLRNPGYTARRTEPAKRATDTRDTARLPFARAAGSFLSYRVPRVPQNTLHPGPHSPARLRAKAQSSRESVAQDNAVLLDAPALLQPLLIQLPLQVILGQLKIRLQTDGFLGGLNGFVPVPHTLLRGSDVVVGLRISGTQL